MLFILHYSLATPVIWRIPWHHHTVSGDFFFSFILVAKTTNLTTQTCFTAPVKKCAQNTEEQLIPFLCSLLYSSPGDTFRLEYGTKEIQYTETLYTRSHIRNITKKKCHSDNTWEMTSEMSVYTGPNRLMGQFSKKHANWTPDNKSKQHNTNCQDNELYRFIISLTY